MDEMLDEYYDQKTVSQIERNSYGEIINRVQSIFKNKDTGKSEFFSVAYSFCSNGLVSCSERIYEKA